MVGSEDRYRAGAACESALTPMCAQMHGKRATPEMHDKRVARLHGDPT